VKQKPSETIFARQLICLLAVGIAFQISCVNLPRHPATETRSSLVVPTNQTKLRVNLNTASQRELESLPGVGKVIAERIIAHRDQYGPFRREAHLMMVRGISDRKFRTLRPLIKVE
jgi:competence ComEA-like helix-hairpin-helix protein